MWQRTYERGRRATFTAPGGQLAKYNSQQIAAAALGQQFGELGQEYARAGHSIPNKLEIRPGYRLAIMVNNDMHRRPYVDQWTAISGTLANM